jgi:hypothetical protein
MQRPRLSDGVGAGIGTSEERAMALDIRIRADKPYAEANLTLSLRDDGYYWFLHPLFERLRDESGKYLDLYGDAVFTRDDYPRLRRLLDEADRIAQGQPRSWEVHVGTELRPTRKEIYRVVERENLLGIISTFRRMVDVAERLCGVIECIGD